MSKLAKLTFYSACAFTASAVAMVHYRQITDRELLHQGIARDFEHQQKKKIANQHTLQTQIDITKALQQKREAEQNSPSELSSRS